jgi:hypothetical protein
MIEFKLRNTIKAFTVFIFMMLILSNMTLFSTDSQKAETLQYIEEDESEELEPLDHGSRAEYTSDHVHPISLSNEDGDPTNVANVDEDANGDLIAERTGKDSTYTWIQTGYPSASIPASAIINNLTVYMGYRSDPNWALAIGYIGLVWTATSGGTQNDISDYTVSTSKRNDIFTITSGLPSEAELNNGIFLRVNGRDSDAGGEDDLWLDYLYFTVNYSIPNVVINEILTDPAGGPYNDDWSFRKKITINSSEVAGDLEDFPVLINITDSDLSNYAKPNGFDILFTLSDKETKLDHEIESYFSGTGELVAWIKIPFLSSTLDTDIYMYYGNSNAENQQNPKGVWNESFVGVWHLNENGDGTSDEFSDSTSYDNHGQGGSGTPSSVPTKTGGKIAGGQNFDGVDDHINCGYDTSLDIGDKQITLEAWIDFSGYDPSNYLGIMSHDGWNEGYRLVIRDNGNPLFFHLPEDSFWLGSSQDAPTNSWAHVVGVYDGSKMMIYINGMKDSNEQIKTNNIETCPNEFWIGHGDNVVGETYSYPWSGMLDEIRISNVARSADWIATEYNNQNDTISFYTLGAEEINKGSWLYRKQITIDSSKVANDLREFPMLINITDSDLALKARSDGYDIEFTDSDGITILDFEIESYDGALGQLFAWVSIPLLSSTTDTIFYLYYGNSDIGTQSNPTDVWDSNYVMVHHLEETSGTPYDSTSYDNDGFVYNNVTMDVVGKINGADEFEGAIGVDDYIDCGNDPSLYFNASRNYTWSAWVLRHSNDDWDTIFSKFSWTNNGTRVFINTGGLPKIVVGNHDNEFVTSTTSINLNKWYHIVVVYNGSTPTQPEIHINGAKDATTGSVTFRSNMVTQFDIGYGWTNEGWNGVIDEVRVSNIARSESWINTSFQNQYDTTSFFSVGNEESVSNVTSGYEWVELYNYGDTPIDLTGWYLTDSLGNKFDISGAGSIQAKEYLMCHLGQLGTNSSNHVYGSTYTISIQPSPAEGKDTYISDESSTINYGSNSYIRVMNTSSGNRRTLIQFELTSLPEDDMIIDAHVWLYRYGGSLTDSATTNVHKLTQSWTETGATWDTYDGTNDWPANNDGGDYDTSIEDTEVVFAGMDRWYSWDITDLTKGWVNGTYQNYGMVFVADFDTDYHRFLTSDYLSNPSLRPKLVVTVKSDNMLGQIDSLSLCDNGGYLMDYIAWGGDASADDDIAASLGMWTDGEYIDTSLLSESQTLGRDAGSTDTDLPLDWENASGYADPFGIDRSDIYGSSPGERNIDPSTSGPLISSVSTNPGSQVSGGYVNVTCSVTGVGVFGVWLNISLPSGGHLNVSMEKGGGDSWFYNAAYFTLGTYQYTIWANDTLGNWSQNGVFQFFIYNSKPQLSSGQVSPQIGYIESWFNFTITYSDLDDHAPGKITLNITGYGAYDLIEMDSLDMVYSDGKEYYFNLSGFAIGNYSFHFAANDTLGSWDETNVMWFLVQNRDLELSSLSVDPSSGYLETWFNFSLTYTDLDNDPPERVTVNITGVGVFDLLEFDSFDTDYSDGKNYYYNLSGFAIGNYSFHFAANNTMGSWDETSVLWFLVQNRDLELSSLSIDPNSGYLDTWFNFSLTYTDLDDHPPESVTVNITGFGVYDLLEYDSFDTDYSDGKDYYINLTGFYIGNHIFYFAANNTFGTWYESDNMQFTVINRAPQLTSEKITPTMGYNDDWYNFTVNYLDLDNHAPGIITINITGFGNFELIASDSMDIDYTDGKDYYYNLSGFDVGVYSFNFAANDTLGEWIEGSPLQFDVINRAPVLTAYQVDPTNGLAKEFYNFTVNYTDFDDHNPDTISITIVGLGTFSLVEVEPSDIEYSDGKKYCYNTTLSNGSYSFYFSANDSLGLWALDTPEVFAPFISPIQGVLDITDIEEEYSDEITLYATLFDYQNNPISGENVSFFIDLNNDGIYDSGELIGYGNTQFDGSISVVFPMNIEIGDYNYSAVYTGSDDYQVMEVKAHIIINPKSATLTTKSEVVNVGTTIFLNATLLDSEGDFVANEPVLFYLDKSRNGFYEHSELIVLVTTSASGLASINYYVNLTPENYGVRARYIGSENYLVTEIEGLLIVQSTGNIHPTILGIVPNQIKYEDSLPWILDLTSFEDDIEDYGPNLNWYLTGVNVSLYGVTGMNSSNDLFTFIPVPNAYGSNEVVLWLVDSDGDKDSQILWINITPENDVPYFQPIPPDLFVHYDDPTIEFDDPTPWDYTYYVHDIETPKENLILTTSEPATYSSEGWIEIHGLRATFHYPQSMVGKSVFVTLTLSDDADFVQTVIMVNITSDWVPELVGKLPNVVIRENSTISDVFDLDDYFTDKDQDSLYFSSGYSYIRVDIRENHSVDITSFGGWIGSELVTFRAKDPIGAIAEDTITVTILPVNNGPEISNVPNLVVHYDYSYPFDLTPYIHDIDNLTSDLLIWTSESTDHITVQQKNNLGIIVNYPESKGGLSIPVTIYVSDGFLMDSYEITINVTDNFPPELVNAIPDVYFSEDTTLENAFILSDYFLDVDSAVLYYTEGTDFINVTINDDFSVNFEAPENWYGSEMVTFRATDPFGALAEDMIFVVVVPVNDAPIINSIPRQEKNEGDQWILDLSQFIDDIDNDISELTISVESEAGEGYVTLVGTILIFQYPEDVNEDMVSITVSDGELKTTRSFVVRILSSEIIAPTLWDIIPWPWIFSLLLIALGGAFVLYRRSVGYQVYEAYLIHEKGLPIANVTQDEGYELEDVLVSGMFTAVQDFIGDTFSSNAPDDDWELDEMKFGENKILIERSKNLFLAVIFEGHGKKLRLKVKKLLGKINDKYASTFEDWNGDMTQLGGINPMIMALISKKPGRKSRNKKNVVLIGPENNDDVESYDVLKRESDIVEPSIDMLEGFIGEINRTDLYECPVCGSDIGANEIKCPVCATEFGDMEWMKEELSMTLNELMECPSCGAEVTEYSSICPECGVQFIRNDGLSESQKEQNNEENISE